MAVFIAPEMHMTRIMADQQARQAVISEEEAIKRLRAIPGMEGADEDCKRILFFFGVFHMCYRLDKEVKLYGEDGYFFPCLRPTGKLFLPPPKPQEDHTEKIFRFTAIKEGKPVINDSCYYLILEDNAIRHSARSSSAEARRSRPFSPVGLLRSRSGRFWDGAVFEYLECDLCFVSGLQADKSKRWRKYDIWPMNWNRTRKFWMKYSLSCKWSYGTAERWFSTSVYSLLRSPFHDIRYRLYSNGMLLRDFFKYDNQALMTLEIPGSRLGGTNGAIFLIVRGRVEHLRADHVLMEAQAPQTFWPQVVRMLPQMTLQANPICPTCAQIGAYTSLPCNRGHTLTATDFDRGVVMDPSLQGRNSLWDPRHGDAFYKVGLWTKVSENLSYTELVDNEVEPARKVFLLHFVFWCFQTEYEAVRHMFYKFVGRDNEQNFKLNRFPGK